METIKTVGTKIEIEMVEIGGTKTPNFGMLHPSTEETKTGCTD
jgi:hypothetical protein